MKAKKQDEYYLWIKKGTLPFPTNFSDPIIMVGPGNLTGLIEGTGVAPFLSYIREKDKLISEKKVKNKC